MTTSTTAAPTSTGPALREGFREPKAGELVRYENPTAPGAERAWKRLSDIEDDVHWCRSAPAHAISSKGVYGGDVLSGFAHETGASYSTVRDYLATYRRVLALSPVARATVLKLAWLRYSHYRAANPVKGDRAYTELLTSADRDRWSVAKLAEEVSKLLGESRQEELPEMPPATEIPEEQDHDGARRHAVAGFLVYLRERHRIRLACWDDEEGRYRQPDRTLGSLLDEYFGEVY